MNKYYKINLIILITILYSIKTYDIVFFMAINTELLTFTIDSESYLSNYTPEQKQNSTLIKTFRKSNLDSNIKITFRGESTFSFIAIAIIIKSDTDKSYYLLTPKSKYYECTTDPKYISLVENSIWYNNKKIPDLASVISCSGEVVFTYNITS